MDLDELKDYTNQKNAYMIHSGITVLTVAPDRVTAQAVIGPNSLNAGGGLHGGVYFTLADASSGVLCRADGRKYCCPLRGAGLPRFAGRLDAAGRTNCKSRGRRRAVRQLVCPGQPPQCAVAGVGRRCRNYDAPGSGDNVADRFAAIRQNSVDCRNYDFAALYLFFGCD